jgi:hypothetical protein
MEQKSGGVDIESKRVDVEGDVTGRDSVKSTSIVNEGGPIARYAVIGLVVIAVAAFIVIALVASPKSQAPNSSLPATLSPSTLAPSPLRNNISNFRVQQESDSRVKITVDYIYDGNHGDKINSGIYVLRNGEKLPWFGWDVMVIGAGSGTVTTRINYDYNNPPTNTISDQIVVTLYANDDPAFYSQIFDYPMTWHTTGDTPTIAPPPPTNTATTTCNASALFQHGWDLINQGMQNCDEAINSMSQAILCTPDNPEMWYGRGNIDFQCGTYPNAISDLTEAIKRYDRNSLYYEMRGLAYMRIEDRSSFEACVQDFNRVLELSPNNADAEKNRDLCQQRLK